MRRCFIAWGAAIVYSFFRSLGRAALSARGPEGRKNLSCGQIHSGGVGGSPPTVMIGRPRSGDLIYQS